MKKVTTDRMRVLTVISDLESIKRVVRGGSLEEKRALNTIEKAVSLLSQLKCVDAKNPEK